MSTSPVPDWVRRKQAGTRWPSNTHPHNSSPRDFLTGLSSTHPELEDQSLLAWGLEQSESIEGPRAQIDVLVSRGSNIEWSDNISDEDLEAKLAATSEDATEKSLQVFFINTRACEVGWLPGNFSIRPQALRSLMKAGLSKTTLSGIYMLEGTWAKMGNHCFQHQDDLGNLSSFEVCYRNSSGWNNGPAFTQFVRTRFNRTYFCINYPSRAIVRLKEYIEQDSNLLYRDFFLDLLAAHESLKEHQFNIGDRREQLLKHERKYEDEHIQFNHATRELHRLTRDWHTLGQDCIDLHVQLKFLQDSHKKYVQNLHHSQSAWEVDTSMSTGESFEVLISECDNCARWTTVYRDRTNIRINLLFHLANQRESRTNTDIATSTAKVAEQTQRDSVSMITIAAVTMLFLPGTFVSAILSTTFFEFGHDGLSVSGQWWVLPVATIPLMVIVAGVWLRWQHVRLRKREANLKVT
ncbi:hypothetical protein BDV95DRAFT_571294 [Massariosphaeria phaeospora]|uniref:Uncharacterized protein n=1 Tax=Massariosphaeria phaeospora TaxID=100035 RepID=A0A7C8IA47_9PLEO|nr:hypothetical protein BDV95DRAFT_571294 [Massariosphaeria phaeospora]